MWQNGMITQIITHIDTEALVAVLSRASGI